MIAGPPDARLAGTGRVADDLYLLAHDDRTGRPYLQPRALGLGLAGGLLAELLLAARIEAGPHGVVVADPAPPRDGVAARVLDLVAGEREQRPAGEWLAFLARTAAGDVAARLAAAGYLARVGPRGLRRTPRWVPVDSDYAFMAVNRALRPVDPARPVTAAGAVLAGLAEACGLGARLQTYGPPSPSRDTALMLWPGLHELITQTRAAADSAVLTPRR